MKKKEPIITINDDNDSITLSDIIDGHRVSHTYYGYTVREAIQDFTSRFYEK